MIVGIDNIRYCQRELLSAFRRPIYRTMRAFAEEEIVIPTGPFANQKFRCDRQPFTNLWFQAVDDPRWREIVATGPSQTGKTLLCFVLPILYHLFELRQDVIAAVPMLDMVADKWYRDIEPVLSKTRYAAMIPALGAGSRGGRVTSIRFSNGTTLRFLTAGGTDKARAGFTAPIVCMTETDGFDLRTSTSAEADKITQIEARVRAFQADANWRIYKECTLTTERGHTWRRFTEGSASQIQLPCKHCQAFVMPAREDFTGWQNTPNELDAMDAAAFHCPACGEVWTEEDRLASNMRAMLIHRGQSVENGQVIGDVPRTVTLGFRWSAVNNMLLSTASLARDEWNAAKSDDEDNEERRMCQFVWAVPYVPKDTQSVLLSIENIVSKCVATPRGTIPADAYVTIGIDVNKSVLHWTAIAWQRDQSGVVIDYGRTGCKAQEIGFAYAIQESLRSLHQRLGSTWTANDYTSVYVDSRWETSAVVAAIKSLADRRWRPFFGLGQGHWSKRTYTHPSQHSKSDIWIGDRCYERVLKNQRAIGIFADANFWKTWLHQRIALDAESDGSLKLFNSMEAGEHITFAKHLTAEREVQSFERGIGYLKRWEAIRSSNHWLDSTYMACVGGHRYATKLPPAPVPQQARVYVERDDDGEGGFRAPQFN